jgi:hypothetical protein
MEVGYLPGHFEFHMILMSTNKTSSWVSNGMEITGAEVGYGSLAGSKMTFGTDIEIPSSGNSDLAFPAIMFVISPIASMQSELFSVIWHPSNLEERQNASFFENPKQKNPETGPDIDINPITSVVGRFSFLKDGFRETMGKSIMVLNILSTAATTGLI